MPSKQSKKVLRSVTQRVVDTFTNQGFLFTALDISNVVKATLQDVRHREVSPLVREMFDRGALGDYTHTLIDVLAEGTTPTQAYLYHLPEHETSMYDETMRSQLAIPPVSTSTSRNDSDMLSAASVEAPVAVGRDGRGRVPRQLLINAGIDGDKVYADGSYTPPVVTLSSAEGHGDDEDTGETLDIEHPSLLQIPRRFIKIFDSGTKLVARVKAGCVEIVPES